MPGEVLRLMAVLKPKRSDILITMSVVLPYIKPQRGDTILILNVTFS
jgi:hypothetical protein